MKINLIRKSNYKKKTAQITLMSKKIMILKWFEYILNFFWKFFSYRNLNRKIQKNKRYGNGRKK